MQPAKIGFFQLENLIKNRIPFSLAMIGVDLSGYYPSMEKNHIQRQGIVLQDDSVEKMMSEFESKNIPKSQALVFICDTGEKSFEMVTQLTEKGYINAFAVEGGMKQFLAEKNP